MKIKEFEVNLMLAEKNLRQSDLAELSGISRVTINSVLNGKTASARTIQAIAKALDVPVREIISEV